MKQYITERTFDANGKTIDVLREGKWHEDKGYFEYVDHRGLETRCYKKDWVYNLIPIRETHNQVIEACKDAIEKQSENGVSIYDILDSLKK